MRPLPWDGGTRCNEVNARWPNGGPHGPAPEDAGEGHPGPSEQGF